MIIKVEYYHCSVTLENFNDSNVWLQSFWGGGVGLMIFLLDLLIQCSSTSQNFAIIIVSRNNASKKWEIKS